MWSTVSENARNLARRVWEDNRYWAGACITIAMVALAFLGPPPRGVVILVHFIAFLLVISLVRSAFLGWSRSKSLEDAFRQEQSKVDELRETVDQLQEYLQTARLQIQQLLNPDLPLLVQMLCTFMNEVEATFTYKQLASGIGRSRLPIASLASGEQNLVRATVNFPNSPPLSKPSSIGTRY